MKLAIKKIKFRLNLLALARRSFLITAAAALALFGITLGVLMRNLPRALSDAEAASALQAVAGARSIDGKKYDALIKFFEEKRQPAGLDWNAVKTPFSAPGP